MAFTPLVDEIEIKEAFCLFAKGMVKNSESHDLTFKSRPGSGPDIKALWNESLGIWSFFDPDDKDGCHKNSYWCPFGVQDPSQFPDQSSTCEINFPKKGIDRRLRGAFVRDDEGSIYLTHNGGVRGRIPGISKKEFLQYLFNNTNADTITVTWQDGEKTKAICIGRLSDPEFPSKVANFVYNVSHFKEKIKKDSI